MASIIFKEMPACVFSLFLCLPLISAYPVAGRKTDSGAARQSAPRERQHRVRPTRRRSEEAATIGADGGRGHRAEEDHSLSALIVGTDADDTLASATTTDVRRRARRSLLSYRLPHATSTNASIFVNGNHHTITSPFFMSHFSEETPRWRCTRIGGAEERRRRALHGETHTHN